jgi:AraC-like DNA-binding protein
MRTQAATDYLPVRQQELLELADRFAVVNGIQATAVPGLFLIREPDVSQPLATVYEPSLCLVLQGAKTVILEKKQYRYGASSFLIVSVHLPTKGQIVEASPNQPYLCVKIRFQAEDIWQLLQDSGSWDSAAAPAASRGITIGRLEFELADAVLRYVRLLERRQDIPVLAPVIHREILYRLLQDPQGRLLRDFAAGGGPARRIAQVIAHIRDNYDKTLAVAYLAGLANMSASALHGHFKEITGMSPLQYQKQIRLQEARRLLLSEQCDAAGAAYRVGYESPSQFSREYARLFGLPPASDRKRQQHAVQDGSAIFFTPDNVVH